MLKKFLNVSKNTRVAIYKASTWLAVFQLIAMLLDVPPQVSQKLRKERGILKSGESNDIHEKDEGHLYKAYLSGKYVSEKYNWSQISCVDNNGDILSREEIHKRIMSRVLDNKKLQQIILNVANSKEQGFSAIDE